jgi:hypothetical protein
MKDFSLKDIFLPDRGHGVLSSTFGWYEFEEAALKIIEYLQDDSRQAIKSDDEDFTGWYKRFLIDTIEIEPVIFAMMCASGFIENAWCPNYFFTVSDTFIERIFVKVERMKSGARY